MNKYFARGVWNPLPGVLQREISHLIAPLYHTKVSRHFVDWFCHRYKIEESELNRYRPASAQANYLTFQDFFTRKLARPLEVENQNAVWPCQGYVCDYGFVGQLENIDVKGQSLPVRKIFNRADAEIPSDYFFVNIFLHNHNYHRFHAPISGRIKKIERLAGQLVFLRPWLYRRNQVSEPSFRNERVVVEIECQITNKSWFLSFVGGMGVGKIKLSDGVEVGTTIQIGQEIGMFLLGSTCCIAMPKSVENLEYLKLVDVGQSI